MKASKRVLAFLLSFAMVIGMAAVAAPQTADAAKVTVKSVKVKAPYAKKAYVAKGKSIKLSTEVSVKPSKSANKKVTFTSRNKKVATVTSKGVVKAKKAGTAKIVVTSKKNKKKKTTVTVKVVNNAVKKVKLNKKNASLNVGGSVSLKATVSANKGASKKIYWKSSKTSVATVSQKGVVKAKAAGTATITALAADGSNKKATCKINVAGGASVNAVSIVGMKVMNAHSITFSLSQPYALDVNSIIVMKKRYANGPYNYKLKLDTVQSADLVNYTVSFTNDSLSEGNYVQLQIPGLSGTKVVECQYFEAVTAYTDESIYTGIVGSKFRETYSYEGGLGYCAYSLSGLPAGLSYKVEGDSVVIKGTPVGVGITTAIITATDEAGNTYTEKMTFCIGAANAIAAAATDAYGVVGTSNSGTYMSKSIYGAGGSGNYNYSMVPNSAGLTVDSYGDISGYIKVAGDYQVTVNITDATNPAIATSVVVNFHVVQGHTVTGIVTDGQGNPVDDNAKVCVSFTNKDKANKYLTSKSAYANSKGVYEITLPTGNYDIRVYDEHSNATTYAYNYPVVGTGAIPNIALPIYKVALVAADGVSSLSGFSWKDTDGNSIGSGSTIYVKPGTYTITAESSSSDFLNTKKKASALFTVVNTAIQTVAYVEVVRNAVITPVTVPGTFTATAKDGEYSYYSFVAPETADYKIYSSDANGNDTVGILCDANGTTLDDNDDGGESYQFLITHKLTAGQTYYIGAGYVSDNRSGSFPVTVEKIASDPEVE